jgi:NADH-quinone oxidoreductase subunit M
LLVDGSRAPRVFSLIELGHGGFVPVERTLFGVHRVAVVYGALFVGGLLTLGVPPLSSWLTLLTTRAPAHATIPVSGGITLLGGYGLVRVGFTALPAASAWAAPAAATLGVLGAVYASFLVAGAKDLRRFVAAALAAQASFVLIGLSSLTGIGVQAALLLMIGRALFAAVGLGLDAVGLGEASSPEPAHELLRHLVVLAGAAGPGSLGFLGVLSALAGAMPTQPAAALAGLLPALCLGGAALRFELGGSTRSLAGSGASPVRERDTTVLLTLAVLLLGLGLWPRPILRLADSSCLDQAEHVNGPSVMEIASAPATGGDRLASRRARRAAPSPRGRARRWPRARDRRCACRS